MGSAQFIKASNIAASATRNDFTASTYTGDGVAAGQLINVGHQPDYVNIWQRGSLGSSFDYIYGANNVIHHTLTAGTGAHAIKAATNLVLTNASGFKVKGSTNTTNIGYIYWATKEY